MNEKSNNQMDLGNLSADERKLLGEIRSDMEFLGDHMNAELPDDVLAVAKAKAVMQTELHKHQSTANSRGRNIAFRLPAGLGAIAAMLIVAVSAWLWLSGHQRSPIGQEVIVYSAPESQSQQAAASEISDHQLGLAWVELAKAISTGSANLSGNSVEIYGGGLGLYADSDGIFTVASHSKW